MTGGSSFEVHAEHAAAAIAAGLCDVVVSVYASTPRSDRKRSSGEGGLAVRAGWGNEAAVEWEVPVRPAPPDAPVRARGEPPHARVRHDRGAARRDRRAARAHGRR